MFGGGGGGGRLLKSICLSELLRTPSTIQGLDDGDESIVDGLF